MLKTVKKTHTIKRAIFIMAATALPLAAHAAGLGKVSVLSALGQSFKAEIEVFATSEEASSLQAGLASVDTFRQADVEYVPVLASLKFSPVKERDGRRYIQVTTDRPLNEPFVDMLVELNWAAGRLVREYTFLLDPPDLAPADAAAAPVAAPEFKPGIVTVNPAAEAPPVAPAPESPAAAAPEIAEPAPLTARTDAADKESYTVVPGDTLGKIAVRNLPAGVSLDQMLVALFRANQQAFSGNNMNRLRAGKILVIPDSEAASGIAAKEARQEVVAQAADFNAYRKKLAAMAASEAASQESVEQATSGKVVPKVAETPPAGSVKDKLEVSRGEATKDGKEGKPGRAVGEEDLVARDRALKEANSRAAELEKNLSNMKKLAELKSQAGADLQQQAQAASPAVTPPAAPEAQNPAVAAASVSGTAAVPPAETAKPAETSPPPAAKKKAIIPPPEPEPEPGFMEENGMLVLGGGGLLAIVLGWFGFSAWKKRKAAAETDAGNADNDFSVHSGFSAPSSVTSATSPPSEQQTSQFGGNVSPAEPAMDALAEADTFLAFGRDAQAEEVLLAALETEPERHAIYLKLLEIYAARKNRAAFATMAKRLHGQTGGDSADWEKAMAMGALLDPENSLYKLAVAPPIEPSTELPAASPSGEDFGSTMVMQASPLAAESPEPAMPAAPMVDLDTAPEAIAAAPDMAVLDFDLDLGPADAAATLTDADASSAPLDLSLGDDAPSAAKASGADSNSIDFDFDLTLDTAAPAAAAPLDLGGIDLDLDEINTPNAVSPAPTFDVTGGADAAENTEVATKLELAVAYEEMGDRDGARELYQEALAEGNAAQKETARSKLASFG